MPARSQFIQLATKFGMLVGALFIVTVLLAAMPGHHAPGVQSQESQQQPQSQQQTHQTLSMQATHDTTQTTPSCTHQNTLHKATPTPDRPTKPDKRKTRTTIG